MRNRPSERPTTGRFPSLLALVGLSLLSACGLPSRSALLLEKKGTLPELPNYSGVRAIDGFENEAFQDSFDEAMEKFVERPIPEDGRRDFDILVLSSGGVNGSFGAGILQGWSSREEGRPDFEIVTGVSVGSLLAPFAFAGSEFDARVEKLFRRLNPEDLHESKGALTAAIFDESLLDNTPLRELIERGIDQELVDAIVKGHDEGRRLYVGSTNLDLGEFVVWDLGAVAKTGGDDAVPMIRKILAASASIPVAYPPTRFEVEGSDKDELHVDGAVIRPLFLPQGVFDGYQSAKDVGLSWDDVDATMYVITNGSLRSLPAEVERDTFDIAMRSIVLMSYTMIGEDILHLYMLSRVWGAEFRFLALEDGVELSVADFTDKETEKLFLLGRGQMERPDPWDPQPPGYIARGDLSRIQPVRENADEQEADERSVEQRLDSLEQMLIEMRAEMRASRGGER